MSHLEATLELQVLGQHWQMAQAAEPKQQAAVLPREMMAPIVIRVRNAENLVTGQKLGLKKTSPTSMYV